MHNHELLKGKICAEIDEIVERQADGEALNRDALVDLKLLYAVKHYLHEDLQHNHGYAMIPEAATSARNPY